MNTAGNDSFLSLFSLIVFFTFGDSGVCPNVKKINKGGLDQYGAERFGGLIFPQSEKV